MSEVPKQPEVPEIVADLVGRVAALEAQQATSTAEIRRLKERAKRTAQELRRGR